MSLLHKTEKHKKNNDPIIRLMASMFVGMFVCIFCLISMTWAWFTASVDAPSQTIQSANRSTSVKVYEIRQPEDKNNNVTKTLIKPQISEELILTEDTQTDSDEDTIIAGEPVVWELSPEKSYEVVMTGSGTATTGYCEVALSHTVSGKDEPETKLYHTANFEKENTVKFTYNTGGFSNGEGVTETQYKEYVEKTTPPTLEITSYWGKPAEDESEQVSVMSLRDTSNEIMLLSDGDVLGLEPIPCPEAKAETKVALEGFEVQEGAVISAEEDYKISLTLKEGYTMPGEVVVNIGGTDYVVSTGGAEASDDAPYFDAQAGVLTVPKDLLSDGVMVSVKATAAQISKEETEQKTEEESEESEETADDNALEKDNAADKSSDNTAVADDPAKKEEDGEDENRESEKTPAGGGDGDDEKTEKTTGILTTARPSHSSSSAGNIEEKAEEEKADITLKLSQLTINLEETKIPTNADLVLTLSAKENMELPERIVITLDKTIYDETIDIEEIIEDKTEYVINTDGIDNPEGFEFDTESGKLKVASELLEGVREITIADTEENKEGEDEEDKASLTFEVKNLTFDFTDDEIVTDEDVVITFTAGEGYELPETIVISIDGEEYIIYTRIEDSDKNPEGITFDIETGTLTISKNLLEEAEAITIAAEGIKKEDEENTEGENNDEPVIGGDPEGGEPEGKEPENGTDAPDDDGENEGGTGTTESGTGTTEPTTPEIGNNTDTEMDGENTESGENGEGSTENGTEDNTNPAPAPETGDDDNNTETDPTPPADLDESDVKPEVSGTNEPSKDESFGNDNGEAGNEEEVLTEGETEDENKSEDKSTQSDASNENTGSSSLDTETTVLITPLESKETFDEE